MKGVIFDLDGVIALTEDLHREAFHFAFAGFGANIDKLTWDKLYLGKGHRYIVNSIFGESPANDRLIDKWVAMYQRIAYRAVPVAGVIEYMNSLTCPMIIATGSAKKSAKIILDAFNITLPMVSMEDVPTPKPNPDIFILAASLIKVPVEECLVFEDSIYGIRAGRSAGMKVIALATTHQKELLEIEKPDLIINDFTELNEYTL